MLDQKIPDRPRVALVFADADSAGHLRDAVSNHVEIVYETSAADFDVSRVAGSQATAALVNLDDCESLESVEERLQETGVAVVFNDPEISSQLDGWARARWLRHLTAKLSGNSAFDPPRPVVTEAAPVVDVAAPEVQDPTGTELPILDSVVDAPQLVERPLSPAEIESMTADFVALQEPQAPPAGLDEAAQAIAPAADDGNLESPTPVDTTFDPGIETEAPSPAARGDAMDDTTAVSKPGNEHGDHDGLDIDTEALSAMIDARLAAAEGEPVPESPEVWRVIEGGSVSAVELPPVEPAAVAAAVAPITAAPVDDADVLQALPSLDDWQLVDPEAPVAPPPVAKREEQPQAALSIDFGGLELVPVETVVPIELNSEPIERWMHDVSDDKSGAGGKKKPATVDSKGEPA